MIDELLHIPKEKIGETLAKSMPVISIPNCHYLNGLPDRYGVWGGCSQLTVWVGAWIVGGKYRLLYGLDGTLTRVRGQQSDLGGYLDIVLDMVVYAVIPLGLALGSKEPETILALAVLFARFYINSATWVYFSPLLEKSSRRTDHRHDTGRLDGSSGDFCFLLSIPHFSTMVGRSAGFCKLTN